MAILSGLRTKLRPRPGAATFSALGEPYFRWYFAGNLAFFMAMQMQFVLRGFLAFELTGSASALGMIGVAITLPMLLVAPIGGVVADRVNKKLLLITTQAVAAVASIVPSVLIIDGRIEYSHLLAVSLLTGIVFSINMPARSALVPLLVPRHQLMNAISLQMGGMNLTRIIAPAVGGLLIAPVGTGWVYLFTAILFGVAVLSEIRLPQHGLTATPRSSNVLEEFMEGLRYVKRDRFMCLLVLTNLLIPLFGFPVQQMLPIFADDVFDTGAAGLGMLAAMTGVGGLAGAMVAANMGHHSAEGRLMFLGGIVMGTSQALFAIVPSFGLAMLFIAVAGAGQMLFMTVSSTVIQGSVPEDLRGRVNSLMLMSFGLMPLGVLPVTAIADVVGAPVTIAASSAILIVLVVALFTGVKPLRDLRMEPAAHAGISRVRAAVLVAEGRMTREEADRLSGVEQRDSTPASAATDD